LNLRNLQRIGKLTAQNKESSKLVVLKHFFTYDENYLHRLLVLRFKHLKWSKWRHRARGLTVNWPYTG